MFVDSHCHLDFPDLIVQVDDILSRMQTNRVSHALCVSVNLPDWPGIMKLVEQHDCLWASVGVHPDYEDLVEPTVAQLHAMILEEAGMITAVATDPAQVLTLLAGFNADLVLMDIHMPACSGPELARVLRQMSGYLSLPIIYLSSETDRGRQFEALEVGADGFLTKPVEPARLVTEVSLRARLGEPLPEGVGIDAEGHPTRDAALVRDGGALLPFAGYKGFGLGLMVVARRAC